MRIAWITYDFEEYSVEHVNEMSKEHDVLLVMPKPEPGAPVYAISDRVDHYSFDKPRLRQPLRQLRSVKHIRQRIAEFNPDVVHFQQGHLWLNSVLNKFREYPLVVTIHDPRHHAGDSVSKKTPQWVIDYGFRQANHAIVHGEALAEQVHNLFQFREDQIHVIPHVAMGKVVGQATVAQEPNNVLFFGRIWDYKGLEYLIAAAPLIAEQVPEVKIVIAGEGDDFTKYQASIGDSPLFDVQNRWIDDTERAEFFQRSSIVVLPYKEATQSGVVPVAYTYARAVVATSVGALAECVAHNETGLLVPTEDPRALADAIIELLTNPQRRDEMGEAGRQRMLDEASAEVVAAQTVKAYEIAIADHRRPDRPTGYPARIAAG